MRNETTNCRESQEADGEPSPSLREGAAHGRRRFLKSPIVQKIWNSSPSEWLLPLRRRVLRKPIWEWDYSLRGILARRKHLQPAMLIDRWHRYWRVIERQAPYGRRESFGFEGRVVLEIGCGPLLGWGPIALFLGADGFVYEEPWLRRDVLLTNEIRDLYFRPLFEELTANFGPRHTFEGFLKVARDGARPLGADMDAVDIVLSNSTLEHIPREELPGLLLRCRQVCSENAVYLHAVDFGDHLGRQKGFGTIYQAPNRPRRHLNLLRKPDLEVTLREAGFSIDRSVVYRRAPASPSHPDWQRYESPDLEARVVLFVGTVA